MKADKLEELYREKFSGFSIEPSERAKNLFNERITGRRRKLWYRRLSVAASLILISLTGALLLLSRSEGIMIGKRSNIVEGNIRSGVAKEEKKFEPEESSQIAEFKDVFPEKEGNMLVKEVKKNKSIGSVTEKSVSVDRPSEKEVLVPIESGIVKQDAIRSPEVKEAPDSTPDLNTQSDTGNEAYSEENSEVKKPVKITIEYIAGNSGKPAKEDRKEIMHKFYSNVNNLLYPDEVLGDIRSLKDQLFAFDFENEKKSETQNKDRK